MLHDQLFGKDQMAQIAMYEAHRSNRFLHLVNRMYKMHVFADDGSPHAGNRVELEAMHDQLYHKGQTAQVAMYEAHKERKEWDHQGGDPPLHSHYGQVGKLMHCHCML